MASSTLDSIKNSQAGVFATECNGGSLKVFANGAVNGVPANVGVALGDQVEISAHALSATAFGAASGGQIVANAITQATAGNTGVPSFYRIFNSLGTAVFQGECGTTGSGKEMIFSVATVPAGAVVQITGLTHTVS